MPYPAQFLVLSEPVLLALRLVRRSALVRRSLGEGGSEVGSISEGGSFSDPSSAAAAKPLPLRPSFARHSGPVLAIATTGGLREGGRVEVGSPVVWGEVGSIVCPELVEEVTVLR
jgi:hypothetical protein